MILLDTNVIGEIVRPRPDPRVVTWFGQLEDLAVSVVTVEEVFFGLTVRPSPRIERWLAGFLERRCKTLDVTAPIARHAGVLRGQLSARGKTRAQADMLIAATAAVHGVSLATRNVLDFEDCGVLVVNPFA
ncbi:MAG TPA: type II toxin-antitoxin system VapC family toxin [Kofleriaceae bacterium]|nr:type II toxin-antitoxin system VapC family toxin [Kofleriaceae bacterium]